MTYASALVGRLDPPPVTLPATPSTANGGRRRSERGPVDRDPSPDQDSAVASTDEDVTAQCDERRDIVRTTLEES